MMAIEQGVSHRPAGGAGGLNKSSVFTEDMLN